MNAADQGGRARSRVDAKVVELAAYRTGKDEPHVRIGRAADIPAALALAEARHQDCRLAVLPWSKSKAAALFELAVHHGDCLLLVAEHEEAIVGIFLGMAAPYYFSEGQVSTDLEFVIAPPFRRRNLATRLLRGYVAWAKELEVPVIQCGNTTIFADDEQSRHFDAAGFRPVGDVLQYRED